MKKYFSLIKFSHTIFAMPFALIGFFLAAKSCDFQWITFLHIILCMIFARSSAMAFNRYIDRDIDKAAVSWKGLPVKCCTLKLCTQQAHVLWYPHEDAFGTHLLFCIDPRNTCNCLVCALIGRMDFN